MKHVIKKTLLVCLLLISIFFFAKVSLAQTCNNTEECNKLISEYQSQITKLQGQASTLKNQIAQFDAQIKLTTLKISQTQEQIATLGGRIDQLGDSLASLTLAFNSRAVETYKLAKFENNFFFVFSASDIGDAVSRFHYLEKIQKEDQNLLKKLEDAQTTYEGEKADQETLEKQLKTQQTNLNAQKIAKNNLLAATKNDESKYQSLLSQAKAQLSSLRNFSSSRGGGVVSHQDLSDSWGKYYNQRDSNWGNTQIGMSSYSVWEVGCLLSSYAMVSTHFGASINPGDVASNTGNFFSNTALFNSPGPSANGHSAIALENPSLDDLKNRLNSGAAIIAGLSANGGSYPTHYSDHWVVLRSVDGDSFKINDPWYEGAMNVSLNDHYSGWTIIQARIYN
jgi:peptidoglycan hydrolase CwlO-like protein